MDFKSNLSLLPLEIIIQISSYLKQSDIITFCAAFPKYNFLLMEQRWTELDFSRDYNFNTSIQYVNPKLIDFNAVTTLNLNGIYWIPSMIFRKFISRFKNLDTLYLLKTTMNCSGRDLELYNFLKVKKLAVELTIKNENPETILAIDVPKVKTLYLEVFGQANFNLIKILFPNASNIWVKTPNVLFETVGFFIQNLQNTKYFIQTNKENELYRRIEDTWWYFKCLTENRKCIACYDVSIETKNVPTLLEHMLTSNNEDWIALGKLTRELTIFSHYNVKQLQKENIEFDKLKFDELNFFDHKNWHKNTLYLEAVINILKSENVKGLKRLLICTCFLNDYKTNCTSKNVTSSENHVVFKKRRIGVSNNIDDKHPLAEIFTNVSDLEALEIVDCLCTNLIASPILEALNFVTKLNNLKCLTIKTKYGRNYDFLEKILKECKKLTFFKLSFENVGNPSAAALNPLHKNIHYATSLEDLYVYNEEIHMGSFFTGLINLKSKKIQRIVLRCEKVLEDKNLDFSAIHTFVQENNQLILLIIYIGQASNNYVKLLQDCLNPFSKKSGVKQYLVKNRLKPITTGVPAIHQFDMLYSDSKICALNALDYFNEF